jgi:hypothetical protein
MKNHHVNRPCTFYEVIVTSLVHSGNMYALMCLRQATSAAVATKNTTHSEKLTVAHVLKESPAFYGNINLIIMFRIACH